MQNIAAVNVGSLLLAEGIPFPTSIQLESTPYAQGWHLLKNIGLEQMKDLITQIGWHILFIAGEFKAAGWSWSLETARRKVILRITAQSTAAKYNCVEIRQIEMKQWFGLTWVGITAQARQIQVTGMLPPGRARISYASE